MMGDVEESLRRGTTTVGLVCGGGVVFAADSRATAGSLIASKRAQKIFEIEPHVGLSTAGAVGDIQALVLLLRAEARLFRMRTKGPISVKGLATLTANIVHGQRYFPYLVQLLMGGVDSSGPSLFAVDLWGGLSEEKVASSGSGSPVALGVLEHGYDLGLSLEKGLELALASVRVAVERDAATGNVIEAAVVDGSGFRMVDRSRVEGILRKVSVSPY